MNKNDLTVAQKSRFQNNSQAWFASHERKFSAESKGENLEITIMDVIGGGFFFEGVTAKSIKKVLDANPNAKNITVLLDSPGGDVFDGVAIHNLLKRSKAEVTVEVLGEASSAASVIAQGASPGKLKMGVGTMMMVHQASTYGYGNADDLRAVAEALETLDSGLNDIYASRNKTLSRDEIEEMVKEETWMTAKEAVEKGFADEVVDVAPPKAKASTQTVKAVATSSDEQGNTNTVVSVESSDPYAGLTPEQIADVEKGNAEREAKAREEQLAKNPLLRAMGESVQPLGGMSAS